MNIPVAKPFFTERENELVAEALRSGWVAQGPMVAQFEQAVAAHEQAKYGIAATSCTTALHLALMALGVAKGYDVIVPSFTFVATANTVVHAGAVPVFADVEPSTFCIDPGSVRRVIDQNYTRETRRLKNKQTGNILWGIIAVHQFGLCADMPKINSIAKEHGLLVLEDAACAIGARIGSIYEGGFGNLSCLSFHPRKSITTGEGGMVLTNDEALYQKMLTLRNHGASKSADARHSGKGYLLPEFEEIGYNFRMNDIQAAVGLAQMEKLEEFLQSKHMLANRYTKLLEAYQPECITPSVPQNYIHTYQSYVIRLSQKELRFSSIEAGGEFRNQLLEKLENDGIATRQGTHAVHLLGYYKRVYGYKAEDYPGAYECDRLSISLPLFVQMQEAEQAYVVDRLIHHLKAGVMN